MEVERNNGETEAAEPQPTESVPSKKKKAAKNAGRKKKKELDGLF